MEIIYTKNFLAIIIRVNSVEVVTLRGTQSLFDWWINVNALKRRGSNGKYHFGFLQRSRIAQLSFEETV